MLWQTAVLGLLCAGALLLWSLELDLLRLCTAETQHPMSIMLRATPTRTLRMEKQTTSRLHAATVATAARQRALQQLPLLSLDRAAWPAPAGVPGYLVQNGEQQLFQRLSLAAVATVASLKVACALWDLSLYVLSYCCRNCCLEASGPEALQVCSSPAVPWRKFLQVHCQPILLLELPQDVSCHSLCAAGK